MKLLEFYNKIKEADVYDVYGELNQYRNDDVISSLEQTRDRMNKLDRLLKSKGYDDPRTGSFARVYIHPSKNSVIKVIEPYYSPCNLAFYRTARNHSSNRHFPRVFRIKNIPVVKVGNRVRSFLVIEMEKLQPLDLSKLKFTNDPEYNMWLISFFSVWKLFFPQWDFRRLTKDIHEYAREPFIKDILPSLLDIAEIDMDKEEIEKVMNRMKSSSYDSFYEYVTSLMLPIRDPVLMTVPFESYAINKKQDFKDSSFVKALLKTKSIIDSCSSSYPDIHHPRLDVHLYNIMMREDNTLVLTDPIAE